MGTKDRDDKFASYLTAFAKNREAVADVDGTDHSEIPVIDMTRSQSALANTIVVIPKRVTGAGDVTIQLWRLITGYAATPTWTLVATSTALGDGVEIRFSNLLAAKHQLLCSVLSDVGSWDLYEAHTEK